MCQRCCQFSKKEKDKPLNPLLNKLDETDLTAFLKRKIKNRHFDDINLQVILQNQRKS